LAISEDSPSISCGNIHGIFLAQRLAVTWIRRRIEAWKSLSVVARALLTTLAMLTGSALVVSATAFAAVSATRAVFPPAGSPASDDSAAAGSSSDPRSERLASGASASEVDADGDALGAAKTTRQKAESKPVVPMKRTQARRGEPTE
jgi:hypothetical protein